MQIISKMATSASNAAHRKVINSLCNLNWPQHRFIRSKPNSSSLWLCLGELKSRAVWTLVLVSCRQVITYCRAPISCKSNRTITVVIAIKIKTRSISANSRCLAFIDVSVTLHTIISWKRKKEGILTVLHLHLCRL